MQARKPAKARFGITVWFVLTLISLPAAAREHAGLEWHDVFAPCAGTCSGMVFAGTHVETALDRINGGRIWPGDWSYGKSTFIGGAFSRPVVSFWHGRFQIEAEVGFGKRFGSMSEVEAWGALFLRYGHFPWNHLLHTTIAASTGLNYASAVSGFEKKIANNNGGDHLLHYLAPEISFALPEDRSKEVVVRMHHRSGAYGIVSNAGGGAQYITGGLRFRF